VIRFLVRRSGGAVLVVFIVSVLTFLLFQLPPLVTGTSPVYYYVGRIPFPPGSPQFHQLQHRFGFDLPLYAQYWNFITSFFGTTITDGTANAVQCPFPCFGYSFRQNDLVSSLIGQALPVSLSLCIGAAVLWLVSGVSVGTLSALRPGSLLDRVGVGASLTAVSLPIFFTGPLLLLVFEYTLGWLPDPSYAPLTVNPAQWLSSMVLPWISLAFLFAALYARITRANMLETMSEDYIRTARAKGLTWHTVVIRHGLRAALTPIVTIFGLDVGQLIGSTIITEQVFNFRGIGALTLQAISQQDLPVIQGVTIFAAVALVAANLVVDFVYALVDPRVAL
jgi:peptide/nickel transport system permease protein